MKKELGKGIQTQKIQSYCTAIPKQNTWQRKSNSWPALLNCNKHSYALPTDLN